VRLRRGDLLPRLLTPPPGPRARDGSAALEAAEAPGVNTVGGGPAILWQEARGANVLDVDGNRYLDLTSGFGAALVGHRHPRVVAAVRRQAARLLHGLGDLHAHPLRVALADALRRRAPMPDPRVYFAVSGADAVELALETALLATGRPGVAAFAGAYHGLSLGTRALTARKDFRRPFEEHLSRHVRHFPFGGSLAELGAVLGSGAVGCVLVEPIQGRGGVRVPPAGWLAELAGLCRRHGVLLAADEILTGCGRTGTFFAVAQEEVVPDLLLCGKALGGGLPLAALIGRSELLAAWPGEGEALHTGTFLAHPLACAAALAVLDLLDGPLAEGATALGQRLAGALDGWQANPRVRQVRGRGALWGVELAVPGDAGRWIAAAQRRGVLALSAGERAEVLELLPPLTITGRQLDAALGLLEATLQALR
jgi:4-aminobutyrate aminotransferase-like enzyme